ncbi:MAG TPA: hypothetical protein VNH64_02230, partial [Parvularculaceae bacterium]|nr:hypothetical protein [Parvularculaceae bacterium]
MRQRLLVPALVLLAACSGPKTATPEAAAPEAAAPAAAASYVASHDALVAMKEKFADIDMDPDVSFLSDEDKKVVNLLNQAADIMSTIYMRQRDEDNPKWRAEIAASDLADKDLVLKLFDLNFGPWDSLDSDKPFYGSTPLPDGAGFYPTDMTREEFEKWIAAHPEDEKAFKSPYTVIRRDAYGGLKAIAYSEYYKEQLEPAAALLREAARITSNASLKRFLILRADAFISDDYYESELAWMDLDGPIEVAIGPYEVYTDRLFGYKTAFEAFVTAKDPSESAAVAKYKNYLHDMEANLPADDRYKNFKRGAASPISVARQVHGGGDNAAGIQIVAFNLPNDERVREAKGAKKVLLSNVLDAKFETILQPMAEHVLVPDQAALLVKKYMGLKTLFHELSHSMGPGKLVIDGRETTVGA